MNTVTHLTDRRAALQAEQADQRQTLGVLRSRLTELSATRAQALRRFDVGVDEAQTEADVALDEIVTTEKAVAKLERQLAEYGPRIEALNQEIASASYRDRCKLLLALQAQERAAWADVAATMPAFFEAWHTFSQIRTERTVTARSLAGYSGAHGLPAPHDKAVQAPAAADIQYWLDLRPELAMSQVAAAIEKAG